jgi:hypothetical protein
MTVWLGITVMKLRQQSQIQMEKLVQGETTAQPDHQILHNVELELITESLDLITWMIA